MHVPNYIFAKTPFLQLDVLPQLRKVVVAPFLFVVSRRQ